MSLTQKLLVCSSLLLVSACSKDSAKHTGGPGDGGATESCDAAKRPILFVHGIMGGGDNFELQAQRFTSNGYCRSAIRVMARVFITIDGLTSLDCTFSVGIVNGGKWV